MVGRRAGQGNTERGDAVAWLYDRSRMLLVGTVSWLNVPRFTPISRVITFHLHAFTLVRCVLPNVQFGTQSSLEA